MDGARRIAPGAAALALRGCEGLDPRGLCEPGDIGGMCEAGECYEAAGAVFVLAPRNGVAWVDAAKGERTAGAALAIDAAVSDEAKRRGLRAVAFQTARPGLVRKLAPRGYRVVGWIVRKEIE